MAVPTSKGTQQSKFGAIRWICLAVIIAALLVTGVAIRFLDDGGQKEESSESVGLANGFEEVVLTRKGWSCGSDGPCVYEGTPLESKEKQFFPVISRSAEPAVGDTVYVEYFYSDHPDSSVPRKLYIIKP